MTTPNGTTRTESEPGTLAERVWGWLLDPPVTGPRATLAIRLMAGSVFFWEGILKFVYANQGVGRFTKLGMPFPDFTATFVGGLEIVGGLMLILGLGTRLITIPFIIEMVVAMLSTKPRLFLGTLPLPPPPSPPQVGIWAVLHEIRSEYAQLMSCVFLLFAGPGPLSLDASLRAGSPGTGDRLVTPRPEEPSLIERRRATGR
jgi:putative oxidoreductase